MDIHLHLHLHLNNGGADESDHEESETEAEDPIQSQLQSYLRDLAQTSTSRTAVPPPQPPPLLTPSTMLRTLASSTANTMRNIMDPNSTSLTSTPAPTTIVAALERYPSAQLAPSATSECCVCQESMRSSIRDFTVLQCGHVLHWSCCVRWLRLDYRCPICRAPALPATEVSNVVIAADPAMVNDTEDIDLSSLSLAELMSRARERDLDVSQCLERSDVEALLT